MCPDSKVQFDLISKCADRRGSAVYVSTSGFLHEGEESSQTQHGTEYRTGRDGDVRHI